MPILLLPVALLCSCWGGGSDDLLALPVEVDGTRHVLTLGSGDSGDSVLSAVERFALGPGRGLSPANLLEIRAAAHRQIAERLPIGDRADRPPANAAADASDPTILQAWAGDTVVSMPPDVPDRLHALLLHSAGAWNPPRNSDTPTIPKTIHHIWWQGREHMLSRALQGEQSRARSSTDWRAQFLPRWVDSWKSHHAEPEWTHRFWNESAILDLARREFGGIFFPLLLSFTERIKKIDTARYLILLKHGGTVVDVDFECFRCIAPLFDGSQTVLLSEEAASGSINCAFMSSRSNHPLWWAVLHEIMWRHRSATNRGVMHQTGPEMLTEAVRWWRGLQGSDAARDVKVLNHARGETRLLYPFSDDHISSPDGNGAHYRETMSSQCSEKNDCASKYPESFAMHHFAASWYDEYAEQLNL